jgi:hypothetical protein
MEEVVKVGGIIQALTCYSTLRPAKQNTLKVKTVSERVLML